MNLFQDILEKIKISLNDKSDFKESILEEINNISPKKLNIDDILIKNNTLHININPTLKMAILLQKTKLLNNFKEKKIPIIKIN